MSYTKHFSKTIHVPVNIRLQAPSATVSDGNLRSRNGYIYVDADGESQRYEISLGEEFDDDFDVEEEVHVNIHVDTDDYDHQSAIATNNVTMLTGSVAATEAAQVKSIHENAQDVAKTIVKGFFSTVKSDISTQVTELHHRVEALLMHLKTQANELGKKKQQMEKDYRRTTARYIKIFTDLNTELENRVKQLDLPVYKLQSDVSTEANRMLQCDCAGMVSVANKENMILESQIEAAFQRKQAVGAIDRIRQMLISEQHTNNTLSRVLTRPEFQDGTVYLPVCFAEMEESKGVMDRQMLMDAEQLPAKKVNEQVLNSYLTAEPEKHSFGQKERDEVSPYLNKMVQEAYQDSTSEHDDRVKKMINKMFKL
jgi:hypothetical protein